MNVAVRREFATTGFLRIKEHILGKDYHLTITIIGDCRSRILNKACRGKDAPANILSFPLSKHVGEIYLNAAKIERESAKFGLSPAGHARFLLIHGCLHLDGMEHGSTMEDAEDALVRHFKLR